METAVINIPSNSFKRRSDVSTSRDVTTDAIYSMSVSAVRYEWHVQRVAKVTLVGSAAMSNIIAIAHRRHPLLSTLMFIPAFLSTVLLFASLLGDFRFVNISVLIWVIVAFGGMYLVVLSAAREVINAKNKNI